jgi:hypothetical protein
VGSFGIPGATFATVEHRLHRVRRAAVSPFFSKASIQKLEPTIKHMAEKMCARINGFKESGQPVNVRNLYQCFTTDVITLYALNRSWNYLDSPDLSAYWVDTMRNLVKFGAVVKFFPWLMSLMEALPSDFVRKLDPGTCLIFDYRQVGRITEVFSNDGLHTDCLIENPREHQKCNGWHFQALC